RRPPLAAVSADGVPRVAERDRADDSDRCDSHEPLATIRRRRAPVQDGSPTEYGEHSDQRPDTPYEAFGPKGPEQHNDEVEHHEQQGDSRLTPHAWDAARSRSEHGSSRDALRHIRQSRRGEHA